VRTPEDAARLPNVDVIGAMPTFGQTSRKRGKDGVVTATMPQTGRTRLLLEYQEFIRILRNSIMVTAMDRPFRTLVITDPRTNENASNVAANLAFSYARLGQKVLLIDADLREPSLHRTFEKTGSSGFAEVIAGEKAWRETVVRVAREQLFLMPAGVMTENSSDLISTGTQSLLETVREEFDLVLIKAPPVLTAAESVPLAGSADAVLVMARAQFTSSKDITAAYSLLRRARANVLGLVVNDVKGLMSPKLHTPSVVASRAA
jgi:capsular exopolysaccharide synthesis family protein